MPLRAVAQVAGVRMLDDQLDESGAAERFRQLPRRRLVEPHQRRLDDEALVHAQVERDLQRLQRVVAAVGISGVIGLAHAADQHAKSAPIGDGRGGRQEQDVAARHERRRQAVGAHRDFAVAGQRRVAEVLDQAEVQHVIGPQPARPLADSARAARRGTRRGRQVRPRAAGRSRSRWSRRARSGRAPTRRTWRSPGRRRTAPGRCRGNRHRMRLPATWAPGSGLRPGADSEK